MAEKKQERSKQNNKERVGGWEKKRGFPGCVERNDFLFVSVAVRGEEEGREGNRSCATPYLQTPVKINKEMES